MENMKIFTKSILLIICCREMFQVDRNILIVPIYLIY